MMTNLVLRGFWGGAFFGPPPPPRLQGESPPPGLAPTWLVGWPIDMAGWAWSPPPPAGDRQVLQHLLLLLVLGLHLLQAGGLHLIVHEPVLQHLARPNRPDDVHVDPHVVHLEPHVVHPIVRHQELYKDVVDAEYLHRACADQNLRCEILRCEKIIKYFFTFYFSHYISKLFLWRRAM